MHLQQCMRLSTCLNSKESACVRLFVRLPVLGLCRMVLLTSYITVIIALCVTSAAKSEAASRQFALPSQ